MRQNKGRRMNPSSGYIGAGNKTSVFTRRSKPPFSKVKEIYGDELERLKSEKSESNLSFKKLTEQEKLEIKERVKGQLKRERRKELIIGIIIFIFVLGIFAIVKYLMTTK